MNDKIDEWHESEYNLKIHEYLGMSKERYKHWVERPQDFCADGRTWDEVAEDDKYIASMLEISPNNNQEN